MGINKTSFDSIMSVFSKIDTTDKNLIEIGIQESYYRTDFKYLREKIGNNFKNYISIDLQKIKGVTIFDLSNFSPDKFRADIITNIGTSEHVEYEDGQYNCWLNFHSWLNIGGFIIHELPELGSWKNHCRYYCDDNFFRTFESYGYKIIEIRKHNDNNGNLIWCVLEKVENIQFMSKNDFFKIMSIDKTVTSDVIDPRNNPKNLKI